MRWLKLAAPRLKFRALLLVVSLSGKGRVKTLSLVVAVVVVVVVAVIAVLVVKVPEVATVEDESADTEEVLSPL